VYNGLEEAQSAIKSSMDMFKNHFIPEADKTGEIALNIVGLIIGIASPTFFKACKFVISVPIDLTLWQF
jgi:hypothetical protein